MYYCFGCGAGGNVFTFIMEYENYSFPEALKYLADRVGIKLPEREYSEEEKRQQDLRMQVLEINKMAANYFYYQLQYGERGSGYAVPEKADSWMMRQSNGLHLDIPANTAAIYISILKAKKYPMNY